MTRPLAHAPARLLAAAALAAGLAACGSDATSGPWLTMPDAATHAAKFPMAIDSAHGICTCNECHMHKDGTGAWVPSDTFKDFTCIGCHYTTANYPGLHHADEAGMAARHAAVPGYQYLDAECKRCHPTGIAVDHAARFPLPHQNAAGTVVSQCGQCHVDPADRKVMGCAACHPHDLATTATAHAKVPDFAAADSPLCLRCHADGTVPRVAAHTGFAVETGVHSGAAGGKCLACHPQNRTAAPKTFAADFTRYTCLGCHVTVGGVDHGSPAALATIHPGSTAADFTDAACYGCHKDGAAGAPANHPQLFPIGAGTRHAGVGCTECHGTGARTDLTQLRCASCHAALPATATRKAWSAAHTVTGYTITSYLTATTAGGTRSTVQVSMTTPAGCLRCHANSQVDRVASHPGGDSGFGQGDHRRAGCFTCHWRMSTTKTWAANFGSASGTAGPPPTSCYVCHRTGSG